MVFSIILIVAILGLYMAWNIGANDVANSMGCAVGSKSISVKWAILSAGMCEFCGAVLVGSHVTDTVRKGIVSPEAISMIPGISQNEAATLLVLGMGAALLASAVWLNVATWMGMPVSTTHSIVGAVAGFGVMAAGWSAVEWGKMGQIVASWFISPVVGGILGYFLFTFISKYITGRKDIIPATIKLAPVNAFIVAFVMTLAIVYKGLTHLISESWKWLTGNYAFLVAVILGLLAAIIYRSHIARALKDKEDLPIQEQLERVERVFAPLVVATSCAVAFSHGANDVANAIGPLAAIVHIVRTGFIEMKVPVPTWVLVLGGAGIVLGLGTYGYRVMNTVGIRITQITPSRGVAANIAAMTTVLVCTRMKLPVSTTHTLVGAVMGVGLARGISAINRQVAMNIFSSWIITVPAAAILAILLFLLGRLFLFDTILKVLS